MTPAARDAAAIAVLDRWAAGEPAEAALTRWARGARYAGAGDREAVRDRVFAAIRRARSARALGGGTGGRAMLLGLARAEGRAPSGWTGEGHAPAPLDAAEAARLAAPLPELPRGVRLDCPDWLLPWFDAALGPRAEAVLAALRERAPLFLRAHAGRGGREAARAALAAEGVVAEPHPLAPWALVVTAGARRLRQSAALREGLVEPQDAASQAAVAAFAAALPPGAPVLDFCAGGGGKALALAALGHPVTAHDADPGRMRDLPARAARARTPIALTRAPRGRWPAVLADVPCSGSGSWRRAPEAKWTLTPARLAELTALQRRILDRAAAHVAPGGRLGYVTCSLLAAENVAPVAAFLADRPGWRRLASHDWTPLDGGDGFHLTILAAPEAADATNS
jgi:16S rRNA (cytosine967-C5)-methyltransferase